MKALLDVAYRRRLYIIASALILGLQLSAYSALLVLWRTNALDRHLFSLSRLSLVSQVVSAVSQALAISSLAALTFFVQGVAADRIIRRPQKLAAIQDLLDAWGGLGSSIVSLWRSRRLGRGVQYQLLVIFWFFAAGSILQIAVPATVTVQSTNSTTPVILRVTQQPELTDADFSALNLHIYGSTRGGALGSLPNALFDFGSSIGMPPGVEKGIWFNTLASPGAETVTFTDLYAQQPSVHCASIPRRPGDEYHMHYASHGPGSYDLVPVITSLIEPHDGVVANFSAGPYGTGCGDGSQFGGPKARKEDPPNRQFSDTLLYLPWSDFSSNKTRDIGTIAFSLISTHDDRLSPDSIGLGEAVNETLNLTVWSWIANDTLSDAEAHRNAFPENVSVTFHYWPIACTMYLEDLTAVVRGDNTLISHSFNDSQAGNLHPFARSPPSSLYERAWGPLVDEIWSDELATITDIVFGYELLPSLWLECLVMQSLNGTSSTSSQKIAALEASLQGITSVAYSLLVQQLRINGKLTNLDTDVQGQQQTPLATLHVNGLQTFLGLLCVTSLFLCVVCVARIRDGLKPQGDRYIIVGDALDLMCLIRGSALPELLAEPKYDSTTPDTRRDKSEKIDVVFSNFKLEAEGGKKQGLSSLARPEQDGGHSDALAATERALARLPYIEQGNMHVSHGVSSLTSSLAIMALALTFLCCLHMVLIVLWASHTLNHRHFDLSKLNIAAQAIAIISQTCTVGALGLLSYGLQRIAADKFIRQEQTVQDLQNTLQSLLGIAGALHALWDGIVNSRRVLTSVAQLCFFWLASSILHITTPTLISVNTVTVPASVHVEVDTMPGNIIDLGANLTSLGLNSGAFELIYSEDLLGAMSAMPYVWGNRNTSIRLPMGVNETSLFSTPLNVSSSQYVITDPYAYSLSVRCGVISHPASTATDDFSIEYHGLEMKVVTLQTFNESVLSIYAGYQYTRFDGVVPSFVAATNIRTEPGVLQFGGQKPAYNSPPNIMFQDVSLRSYPGINSSAAIAERGSVSFMYVSLKPDALSFPSGVDYASPIEVRKNMTIISWVKDTEHPTNTLHGQPVNAFNENVTVTFYIWPLACISVADQSAAVVLGNGRLESHNTSNIPPHTAFPFVTNEPKNQIESNWVPLLDALSASEGASGQESGPSWLETTVQSLLADQPSITTLEDNLASISSVAYSLLIQRWRIRYAANDTALASTWMPQNATVAAEVPVLKAYLQVNGIPLLVGSLSMLVLGTISVMCVLGHGTSDNIVRDGGVIDLISLLHNSMLPEILTAHDEDGGSQTVGDATFAMRKSRARRVVVAYGHGSLDLPLRIQQRENEHLDSLSRRSHVRSRVLSFPGEPMPLRRLGLTRNGRIDIEYMRPQDTAGMGS